MFPSAQRLTRAFVLVAASMTAAASGQIFTEFPIPTPFGLPWEITAGPDGNLWFTVDTDHQIGRITPQGVMTLFPLLPGSSNPHAITAGPDGALWATANTKIIRITTSGAMTEYLVSADGSPLWDITSGPDGNLWYTRSSYGYPPTFGVDRIGRMTPAGAVTEFPLQAGSQPYGITSGPDGNLWFTESGFSRIGRITPAGILTEFALPDTQSGPAGIAPGPDGNLWFTESAGRIGRITPSGTITEFAVPSGVFAPQIVAGPDGNLWFTEFSDRIGRITTAGIVSEFQTPTSVSVPWGITSGPDGHLWITESFSNKVARVSTCSAGLMAVAEAVCPNSAGHSASVPDAGPGATYSWSISGGAITAGLGSRQITFSASAGHTVRISVTVNDPDACVSSSVREVLVAACAARFYTVTPCRAVDTRIPPDGPALWARIERTFVLTGRCGIPTSARAISANLTVTGSPLPGDVRVRPAGTVLPETSTINYREGQTRANNAILMLGAAGDITAICSQSNGGVELIVDVNGYFE